MATTPSNPPAKATVSPSAVGRTAKITRKTSETHVRLELGLDGDGQFASVTGVGFFDHMLELLTRHGGLDLDVEARGDLHVDMHHTVEDVGLAMGAALDQALGDRRGIRRFAHASVPMDDALANVAIDLSGRPAFVHRAAYPSPVIGTFPTELVPEFFKSLATAGRFNLHIHVPYGDNAHHIAEATFKSVARALRDAVSIDPRVTGVPSTKGTL